MILMAQKKHFDETNTHKKLSRLISTVSEKPRKNNLNAFFSSEMSIVGSFWAWASFMLKNQNRYKKFQFFSPAEEEVAKSSRSCTRFEGSPYKSRTVSRSKNIKNVPSIYTRKHPRK